MFSVFQKCFVLFQSVCFLSVLRHGSRRSLYPAIAHCKTAWEFGGIAASAASLLAASPHARRSRWLSQACRLVPGLPLPQARHSREITPPARLLLYARRPASDSMPAGSPLSQSPPDRRCLNARRIAAVSKPAGSPLTQAHRIGADSCPLAAANPSPVDPVHNTARSAVCLSCRAHRNILTILSCLVHRDSSGAGGSSCCGHGGQSSRLPPCRRSGSGC